MGVACLGQCGLLVSGQHKENAAEDIEAEMDAVFALGEVVATYKRPSIDDRDGVALPVTSIDTKPRRERAVSERSLR